MTNPTTRTKATSPRQITTMDGLYERLRREADRTGTDARLMLPVAAVAVLLLGAGPTASQALLTGASQHPDPARVCQMVLEGAAASFDYLEESLPHLTRFLDDANTDTAAGMLAVLAQCDLEQLSEIPNVQGDLLGGLYMRVQAPGDRNARGAFYTPPALAHVMALLADVTASERWNDPCAGCGGLAIATIRAMRSKGRAPELVHWTLGDIDNVALTLASIQLAAHGMPLVELRHGNALLPAHGA